MSHCSSCGTEDQSKNIVYVYQLNCNFCHNCMWKHNINDYRKSHYKDGRLKW
jgi:hypothetical protein